MCFETLVNRISPTLKRITRKLNGHYSFFNDEDLFQEAMVRLWSDYREGALEDKTDSYILQGCYFHLRNYLRKSADNTVLLSLSEPSGEGGMMLEELLYHHDGDPVGRMEGELQMEMAQTWLTDRERHILDLFMEGMTMREIGGKLGISHVMVLKIRNRIKEKYSGFYGRANN